MKHLLLILLLFPLQSYCQVREVRTIPRDTLNTTIADIITNLTDDDAYDLDDNDDNATPAFSADYDLLCEMAENRRNINQATMDDLLEVPYLSEQHVKAILNYRALYGDMLSIAELTLIPAIDPSHRRLLQALFYAAPVPKEQQSPWRSLFDYGRHTFSFSLKTPLYSRKGDTTPFSSGGYQGYSLSHTLRYRFETKHLMAALTAAQDAGEAFFYGANKTGWDYYTGYVRLKDMGIIKNLIIGDYQTTVGMGLLLSPSFSMSRTTMLTTTPSAAFAFRGHSSRSQSNYQRGAAITLTMPFRQRKLKLKLKLKQKQKLKPGTVAESSKAVAELAEAAEAVSLSFFASIRNIDGILNSESESSEARGSSDLSGSSGLSGSRGLRGLSEARGSSDLSDLSRVSSDDVSGDAAGVTESIRTIYTSGYHRTQSEIARRAIATETLLGANISMSLLPRLPLRFGVTILHVLLSKGMVPEKRQQYAWYKPEGRAFTNGSLYYSFSSPRLAIIGETAISGKTEGPKGESGLEGLSGSNGLSGLNGLEGLSGLKGSSGIALATCNVVRWRVSDDWTFFGVQRFYSYRFESLLGRSFGDVSSVQNESGIYLGARSTSIRNVIISTYCDYAYHPWYRYGHLAGASSLDAFASAEYNRGGWYATVKYRYRHYINDKVSLEDQHTMRLKARYASSRWWHISQLYLTGMCSGSLRNLFQGTESHGWMAAHQVGYTTSIRRRHTHVAGSRKADVGSSSNALSSGSRKADVGGTTLSAAVQLAYYDSSDWQTRMYLQQPTVTYGSSMVAVYGRGFHGDILLKLGMARNISIAAACSMNHFFDRSVIGSGMQQINGSTQTDILIHAAVKF